MTDNTLISGIARSMKHLAERQRVISQNIANSETPGFKAQEVKAPDFASLLAAQGGATGTPRIAKPQVQITTGMAAFGTRPPQNNRIIADSDTAETKPDGNNITLEEQLLKMGQIQADFAAMTNLYKKQMAILKTAIGRG